MKDILAKINKRSTLIKLGIALTLLALGWVYRDSVILFARFASDRQAVIEYMESLGALGPLALMALLAAPALIPTLPPEPPMIAGAYIYGFEVALLMNWLISAAASLAVFHGIRRAGQPLARWLRSQKKLERWTGAAVEQGALFFALAFINPLVPSDIMTYIAGLSAISGKQFFWATLIGRLPIAVFFSLVGANGFEVTPGLIGGLVIFGAALLALWWYFFLRENAGGQPAGVGTGGSSIEG